MGVCTPVMQIRCKPISCGKSRRYHLHPATRVSTTPLHPEVHTWRFESFRAPRTPLPFLCILFGPSIIPVEAPYVEPIVWTLFGSHSSVQALCIPVWATLLGRGVLYEAFFGSHSLVQAPCMEPCSVPSLWYKRPFWTRYRHLVWSPVWAPLPSTSPLY